MDDPAEFTDLTDVSGLHSLYFSHNVLAKSQLISGIPLLDRLLQCLDFGGYAALLDSYS